MSTLLIKRALFAIVLTLGGITHAAAQTELDNYIQEAFKTNQGLQQQNIQLDKSLNALKEARSYFMPNVSMLGSYTRAAGGRTIDLPIGDLFNPVYTTLNQLTHSNAFPQIQNASVLLNPNNFYDAKLRTALPLINAEIYYNQKIKKELISQQQASINVYKRELVKNVKAAYYQYYQAQQAIEIYKSALKLINENIRVNESLVRNGVRNSTALTRSEAEKEKIVAAITQATNNARNAKAYFNFLLNRDLETDIKIDMSVFAKEPILNSAPGEREELAQLKTGISAYGLAEQMQRSYLVPKLNTFLDVGSQGFNFDVNNKTKYYLWGVNLQWDLFAGGQHKYKTLQAKADKQALEVQYDQTEKALQLQNEQASNNYSSAVANYKSAQKQQQLSQKYYNDQLKVYKEGQLLYLELVDALNQYTGAQLQLSLAQASMLTAAADIERAQASFQLN
ncbi:MAG: TolC family protein [Taibaiella sp.]|nr:TolC family protein [Taibaiella sp.]